MNFTKNATLLRWILITVSFLIVTIILWNTNKFFQQFKQEERKKMEIIAEAQTSSVKELNSKKTFNTFKKVVNNISSLSAKEKMDIIKQNEDNFNPLILNTSSDELQNLILKSNVNIPIINTDANNKIIRVRNFDSTKEKDSVYLYQQLALMESQNKPLTLTYTIDKKNIVEHIYYRDSDLLTKLKYYPLALLLILILFSSVIYLVFKSTKIAEQNKLWAGMAKETAHQIGTPLSSLLGWIEILRIDGTEESTVVEIEKDVTRLNTIADRFSKIGSIPTLEKLDVIQETNSVFTYLESRSSKQVHFTFKTDKDSVIIKANKQLYGWVIENVIKNAIDAMEGKGNIYLTITTKNKQIEICICDTGKGLAKNQFKQIFETGFTTKKRGWGLGLSLAKRIIEDYHHGKIFVKKATVNKGTCMAIVLHKN